MAAKQLFFKNAVVNGAMSLQDGGTAPNAITTTGWVVGKTAAGNFALMAANTERASTAFSTTDGLASPALTVASCWRSELPYGGGFANTDWTFNFRVRAASAASAQTGRVNCRMWKSPNVDGSGAVQLTTVPLVGSTTPALSQSTPVSSIVTWHPGGVFVFNNEYLFVQCEWEIVATTGNANSDVLFYVDSTSNVVTPDFALFLFPQWHDDVADAFWAPSPIILINALAPALRGADDSFAVPAISTSTRLTAALYTDADIFATPISASEIITEALYVDDDSFLVPVVGAGAVTLAAALYDDISEAFFAPTPIVSPPPVTVLPLLLGDGDAFYASMVGAADFLSPQSYSDAELFYAPGLAIGPITFKPVRVNDVDRIWAAKIVGGKQAQKPRLGGSMTAPGYMVGTTGQGSLKGSTGLTL